MTVMWAVVTSLLVAANASGDQGVQPSPRAAPPFDVELRPPGVNEEVRDNTVFWAIGRLEPRAKDTRRFVLPKVASIWAWLLGDGLIWSFRAPGGEVFTPGMTTNSARYEGGVAPSGFGGFALESPEKGEWTMTVEAPRADTAVSYHATVWARGPAEEVAHLEFIQPQSHPKLQSVAQPGDRVFVRTFVARAGQPVAGTSWDVRAKTPRDSFIVIPVFDDGEHADGQASDGVFVGAIEAEGPAGFYAVRAESRTPDGVQYVVVGDVDIQPKGDLLIADSIVVSPMTPKAREPVSLTVTVVNDGEMEFEGVELELYVNMARNPVSEQPLDLKPGESRRMTMTWVPDRAADYEVQLSITPWQEPYWSDFKNNTRKTTVRVR